MKKVISLFVFSLSILNFILAQNTSLQVYIDGDSKPYVTAKLADFGSIYQLSKSFNTSISEILHMNGYKDANSISGDATIRIPLDIDIIFKGSSIKGESNSRYMPLVYEVKSKETLYKITKIYFKQDVEVLSIRNSIHDNSIKVGQKVIIGWLPSESKAKILYSIQDEGQDSLKNLATMVTNDEDIIVFTKQRGIALWSKNSFNSGQRYVLHSSAKINSEIELYNPMVKRTVTAKVIGRIQNGVYQSDIDVILSAATAQSLGALDSRFLIDMKYVK